MFPYFYFQHEVKVKTIVESMKEIGEKRSALQDEVDQLNEQCAQLKAKEQIFSSQIAEKHREHSDNMADAEQLRATLEGQMESHRDQHHKQLSTLRAEVNDKQAKIDELTGYVKPRNISLRCSFSITEKCYKICFHIKFLLILCYNYKIFT